MGRTIKRSDLDKLISICIWYDPFTMYIDNYDQEKEAQRHNEKLLKEFSEIVNKYTGATGEHYLPCTNNSDRKYVEEKVIKYLGYMYDKVHGEEE